MFLQSFLPPVRGFLCAHGRPGTTENKVAYRAFILTLTAVCAAACSLLFWQQACCRLNNRLLSSYPCVVVPARTRSVRACARVHVRVAAVLEVGR